MKIAMLSEGRYPLIGGGQLYAQYLSTNLINNHNCSIDIFTRSFIGEDNQIYSKNEISEGSKQRIFRIGPTTRFFNLFGRVAWLIKVSFHIYRLAKIEKYDLIHAHALLPGLAAKIVGNLLKIPVVYTVHGTMHMDTNKRGLLYRGEKFFVTKLKYDLEISVSHKILNYKNINKNIKIIHPAVDPKRFDLGKEIKKYPGINFLFVGRLDRQKGLEYLLQGIYMIEKKALQEYGFHLNIVGTGTLKDKLENMIKDYNLEQFVTMKGEMFGEKLTTEFLSNQVFILPSLAEGQPVVVFEAFLSKLPVIATDVGDNKYFIKDGENGFLIPAGNANVIKETIEKMLDIDTLEYDKMGKNGHKMISENYNREKVSEKVYEEYKLLLSRK